MKNLYLPRECIVQQDTFITNLIQKKVNEINKSINEFELKVILALVKKGVSYEDIKYVEKEDSKSIYVTHKLVACVKFTPNYSLSIYDIVHTDIMTCGASYWIDPEYEDY